ncbi:arginase family protein [uncultured Brevibacillus sp.]|uniref:arginase family protein n=1 Tax=uncultured Brevibacillus sp. TaxID=169970 RepID=UPI0025999F19|nr:arginase family protein [uncultured Brevibacillus sp.]
MRLSTRNNGVADTIKRIKEAMSRFEAIYITSDIDSLDPAYAPGTGTPQFGVLHSRELLDLLYGLFDLPIIGFDVVEGAPALDNFPVAQITILSECSCIQQNRDFFARVTAFAFPFYEYESCDIGLHNST